MQHHIIFDEMESFVPFYDKVFGLPDFKSCVLCHHRAWLCIKHDAKTKHAQLSKYTISISQLVSCSPPPPEPLHFRSFLKPPGHLICLQLFDHHKFVLR